MVAIVYRPGWVVRIVAITQDCRISIIMMGFLCVTGHVVALNHQRQARNVWLLE